jgi:hypothetical protein
VATGWAGWTAGESEGFEPRLIWHGLRRTQEPFDVLFREYVMDVHGVDLAQPMPGPLSEMTFSNQLPS